MPEISIFADESGQQQGSSDFYILALVLHDQSHEIGDEIARYEQVLRDSNLPDIPFHASPLMNGHKDYDGMDIGTRKRLLNAFGMLVAHLPANFAVFSYHKREVDTPAKLSAKMRHDLAGFIFDHLGYLQSFSRVKIYYDGGQGVVSDALHAAFKYTMSVQATLYRNIRYRDYRLFQVADYLCAIELARLKYENGKETNTDRKIFGLRGDFKRNYLKPTLRKLLK